MQISFDQREYYLDETLRILEGPTPEQITVYNQGAAIALDFFHPNSRVSFNCMIDGSNVTIPINWNSNFSKAGFREGK